MGSLFSLMGNLALLLGTFPIKKIQKQMIYFYFPSNLQKQHLFCWGSFPANMKKDKQSVLLGKSAETGQTICFDGKEMEQKRGQTICSFCKFCSRKLRGDKPSVLLGNRDRGNRFVGKKDKSFVLLGNHENARLPLPGQGSQQYPVADRTLEGPP